MARPAIALLSTQNLLHNVATLKKCVGSSKIIAMVKANAYGHGITSVGQKLDGHVDMLGVASIDEAIMLKKAGVRCPVILMYGVYEKDELEYAAQQDFHVVFNNKTQLEWLDKLSLSIALHSWLKINTGLGRLGFQMSDARTAYERLLAHANIHKPIRIMSHFSCADDIAHELNYQQIAQFEQFTHDINTEYSLCNSAGIFHFPQCHFDYVRPGISLYGVSPVFPKTGHDFGLKPVMTVQSRLFSVQKMLQGSYIGYGARYQCPADMLLALLHLATLMGIP